MKPRNASAEPTAVHDTIVSIGRAATAILLREACRPVIRATSAVNTAASTCTRL